MAARQLHNLDKALQLAAEMRAEAANTSVMNLNLLAEIYIALQDREKANAVLDEIYSGAKAGMRPIHDALMEHIMKFGEFEIVPKKGYVSLRCKKQFAMIGPKTNTRFEVGINAKDLKKNSRLLEQPKGSMCNYIVQVNDMKEVDAELITWIRSAFEGAG